MRLLVVGASGQVGRAVLEAAEARGDTPLGGYVSRTPEIPEDRRARIDKADPTTFGPALDRLRPDWVVDTGALHNVDQCESHPSEAFAVNRDGTGALARAVHARGAGFVFVSTDYVFDGLGSPPYRETDPAVPLSVYGRSKLEGEQAAIAAGPSTIVVRPSVVYSWVPPGRRASTISGKGLNFGSWAADRLREGAELRIVQDQVASPTYAKDLAGAILSLVARRAVGTFHTAGATSVDRYHFTVALARALGLDTGRIVPITTASLGQSARRPLNSSLDSSKLADVGGYTMASLADSLTQFAEAWHASSERA